MWLVFIVKQQKVFYDLKLKKKKEKSLEFQKLFCQIPEHLVHVTKIYINVY